VIRFKWLKNLVLTIWPPKKPSPNEFSRFYLFLYVRI